jgi:hypothetical protein
MYDLLHTVANTLVLALASINLVALVSLIGEASSGYLSDKTKAAGDAGGATIRLQLFRVLMWTLSVVVALKVVLPEDLADSVISAWFVGQGFALQATLQSIIGGIIARYDKRVRAVVFDRIGTISYNEFKECRVVEANVASVTIQTNAIAKKGDTRGTAAGFIVLPWNSIDEWVIHL